MTNEQYLIVSYFSAASGGLLAAVGTGLALRGPLRLAIIQFSASARRLFGRMFFTWLILAGLLAFLSVGYFGTCDHHTYQSVVEDMPWMVGKTWRQAERIFWFLLVGVLTYAAGLAVVLGLWRRKPAPPQ